MSIDRVKRKRTLFNDHTKETIEQAKEDDLPEELMGELEQHVGDGEAQLTVSGSLGSSRQFHKAEAFVSIGVSCNNDLADIEAAHDIVLPYVKKLLAADLLEMSKLRDPWLEPKDRLHTKAPVGKAAEPAESEGVVKDPPRRSSQIKLGPGAKKPIFGK